MKWIVISLKLLGTFLLILSILAFGSDFLPVEGIRFLSNGEHGYYKIVPAEHGNNIILKGFIFLILGVSSIVLAKYLTKRFR
ncbi:hypothetical protein [Microbulbifer sp. PSTR4-B]|uniref:hypothetical protein n=1 Tax=Microbulbifer sp. PSTR4-B TaxID=3243396 RepID=UPI004039B99A